MLQTQIEAVIFDVVGTLLPCDTQTTEPPMLAQAAPVLKMLTLAQQDVGLFSQTPVKLPSELTEYAYRHANDTQRATPEPDLPTLVALAMQSHRINQCILISGNSAGIEAGLRAGMWTVGTALSGSLNKNVLAQWPQLPPTEQDQLRMQATMALLNAGAHYVIDAVDELLPCLTDINQRLKKGERA